MPADLSAFLSASPTVILATAIIISLVKPFVEKTVLPPAAPLHDAVIRLSAVVVGCLIVLAATLLALPAHATATGPLVFSALVEGGKAGLFAIVSYHLLTASIFDTQATVIQAPPQQPLTPTATIIPPQSTPAVVVTPPSASPTPQLPPVSPPGP